MAKIYLGITLLAGLAACTLKYEVLKNTSLANPPLAPIKIYIKEFPVESKANVVDPRVANSPSGTRIKMTPKVMETEGSKR